MGSPAAERTVQILDFLTTHPGRGFTLSELARRLRLSKTTAHKILTTLTDRALLVRNADTFEYRLGPALIPMGAVAQRSFSALTYAKREAERLAEEHDAECVILMATSDELLIVGHAGIPGPLSTTFQEGQRQPLAPPMGTIVLAWANDQAVERWLERAGPGLTEAERERYLSALAAVRRQGFATGIRVPSLNELHDLYSKADVNTPEGRGELSLALAAIAHDSVLPVAEEAAPETSISGVAAPVFGPDGTMLFALAITGADYRVRDIPLLSRVVRRAAGRVMVAIDGRQPTAPVSAATRSPATPHRTT